MKKLLLLSGWLLLGFILTTVRATEVYDTLRWTWEVEAGEKKTFSLGLGGSDYDRYFYYVDFGDGTLHEAPSACADTTYNKFYAQAGTYDVMIVVTSPEGRIKRFDCSGDWNTNNRVTFLDVKHCTALVDLRCSFNRVTSLDVSKNVNLTSLYCDTNQLTKLNISENIRLETLVCGGNFLISLDVSKNVDLKYLTCENNRLALSALAGIRDDIGYYYAYPQMIKRTISVGEVLDWRSEMRFDIAETQVNFGGIPSEAYAFTDGYLVFHQPGEYRLSMRNERITSDGGKPINVYYDIIVTTPPEPEEPIVGVCDTIFLTWEAEAGESKFLGLSLSGSDKGGGFWIDFGNGYRYESWKSYRDTMVSYAQSGTYNVTIATTLPDIRITRFNCNGFYGKPNDGVTALDVSRCTDLETLDCCSNGLSKLDISQNRNLTSLSCDSCRLSALDISQNVKLKDLFCGYNRMPLSALAELCASVGYDCRYRADPQEIAGEVSTGEVLDWRSEMRFDIAETQVEFGRIPSEAYAFTNGYLVFYQPGEYDVSMWNDSVAINYGRVVLEVFYHFTVTGEPIAPPEPEEPTAGVCDTIFLTWEAEAGESKFLGLSLSGLGNGGSFWIEFGDGHRYEARSGCRDTVFSVVYAQSGTYNVTIGTTSPDIRVIEFGCSGRAPNERNGVTALDVSRCTALTKLWCNDNQLISLDVSQNVALEQLWCNDNQLSSLDVSHNPNLRSLVFDFNQIATLNVGNNSELRSLQGHYNELQALDVTSCRQLTFLGCGFNQLKELDVQNCDKLETLSCEGNRLKYLNLKKNLNLNYLGVAYNDFDSIDFSPCTNIQRFYGAENHFTLAAVYDMAKFMDGQYYHCIKNQLHNRSLKTGDTLNLQAEAFCDGIPTEFLVQKAKIDTDTILDNAPEVIHNKSSFVFTNPGLYRVVLSNEALWDNFYWDYTANVYGDFLIDSNLVKVYYWVTVTGDPITPEDPTVPDTLMVGAGAGWVWMASAGEEKELEFQGTGRGVRVDWGDGTTSDSKGGAETADVAADGSVSFSASKDSDKELKHRYAADGIYAVTLEPLSGQGRIKSLDVSDERVLALTLGDSTHLVELDCSENLLAYLDLSGAACLEELDCSDNLLTSLDLSGCPNLREVDFSENRLTDIDLLANRNLKEVDGEENRMRLATLYTLLSNRNSKASYEFDPQGDSAVLSSGEWLDLGSEMTIGGRNTTYTVRYAETRKTVPTEAYEEQGGRFRFLEEGRSYLLTLQNRNVTDYEDGAADDRVSFTWCVRVSGVANEDLTGAASAASVWAYVSGRTIYVTDAVDVNSDEVSVYTTVGQRIYRGHGRAVEVPQAGVYILTAGERRMKVLVR